VSLVGVVIVKFTHAIARVMKRVEVRVGRGATFGVGVAAPFVALLPRCWEQGSYFAELWRPRP
jgi:hypothetical protein